jgi:hypothetical protein
MSSSPLQRTETEPVSRNPVILLVVLQMLHVSILHFQTDFFNLPIVKKIVYFQSPG